jgi:hypothetical protein
MAHPIKETIKNNEKTLMTFLPTDFYRVNFTPNYEKYA